jgi:hypothetical protein
MGAAKNDIWHRDYSTIKWALYHPFGITNVNSSGEKWRDSTDWPSNVGLEISTDGISWAASDGGASADEATPASATTWTAWTHNDALGGTYKYLRYIAAGPLYNELIGNPDQVYFEVQSSTLTLTGTPTMAFASTRNNYQLNASIKNTTTLEYLSFNIPVTLNQTMTIDCDAKTGTYQDGRVFSVDTDTPRHNWLDCGPGVTALQFDAPGASNITLNITWRDRNL